RLFLSIVAERHPVMAAVPLRVGHSDGSLFDAVRGQLVSPDPGEFRWCDAVPCQIPVQRGRASIARRAQIAEQHTTTAPTEHQCGAETRWTAADDNDIEHGWHRVCARPSPLFRCRIRTLCSIERQ